MDNFDLKILGKKFPEEDIEWRVQQSGFGTKKPWALIIPYITSRAIMQRLDEAVGLGKWENKFKKSPCEKGYLCGISIKIDDEWVTRWDGAEVATSDNIDNVKTAISNSMKRAGVQWGIGRYLYQFEPMFADVEYCDNRYETIPGYNYQNIKDKKTKQYIGMQWRPKPLESWALPVTDKQIDSYINSMKKTSDNKVLKVIFSKAYKLAVSESDKNLLEKFTKAKDEAKKRLLNQFQVDKNSKQEKFQSVLEEQIKIINCSLNESAANGLTILSIKKLEEVSSGEPLQEAIKLINKASKSKINQLKNRNENGK